MISSPDTSETSYLITAFVALRQSPLRPNMMRHLGLLPWPLRGTLIIDDLASEKPFPRFRVPLYAPCFVGHLDSLGGVICHLLEVVPREPLAG